LIDRAVSFSLDHLHWTTREGVAATLIAIADGGSEEAAYRALALLRAAATPAMAPQLARIALRPDLAPRLRERAVEALAATGAEVPDEARRAEDPCEEIRSRAVVYTLDREQQLAAARRLELELPDLIELLGPPGLARALRAAVHDHSFALRCPVDRPETDAIYSRALWLLRSWSEAPAIMLRLLARAALHPKVEADLAETLAWAHRAFACRLVAWHLGHRDPAALHVVRAVLRVLRRVPQRDDRDVLRAALALRDVESRCLALEALDALGEDGDAFRDILRALAGRPEPMVRLYAARALARRGEARFTALIHAARTDPDPNLRVFALDALADLSRVPDLRAACVDALADSALAEPETRLRAEAIHGIARARAAGEHLDLLERALLDDPGREGRDDPLAPVCDNAAMALCIAGGERAREALLRAAFVVPRCRFHASWAAFDVVVTCPEGTPEERFERLQSWGHGFWRTGYWLAGEVRDE
jgi:hypothetical protein